MVQWYKSDMALDQNFLSVIVPVFNEAGNVVPLHREIIEAVGKTGFNFEIIFVDDGSCDNTLMELKQLRPVRVVVLQKNYGQSCALDAGIKNARGDIIVTLDGDGQNDPASIGALLEKFKEGYEVVCGWRVKRMDPFGKRFVAQGARLLRRFLVDDGIHDAGCTLRAYRRQCFEGADLYGGLHRMLPGLLKWQGFKITEIQVNHRPRCCGRTKYNWTRIIQGFRDMLYIWAWRKYSKRPPRSHKKYLIKEIYASEA